MLKKLLQRNVEQATVNLLKKGGQGVLIPGGYVVTAAHCVDFMVTGEMVLGYYFMEPIETVEGVFKVQPLAVEPVADVAILGSLDNQEFPDEAEAFEEFCEKITAIPICFEEFQLFQPFPIYIFTHHKTWIQGTAQQCNQNALALSIDATERIEGGTSGSPIVNAKGELVGVISQSGETEGEPRPFISPRPHLTLPVWAVEKTQRAKEEG